MQRNIWFTSANPCDQTVVELLDGPFGSVVAMQVERGELEGDSFFSHEGLESCGAFIVKSLENGLQTSVGDLGVEGSVS